jgi:hypothetical protein
MISKRTLIRQHLKGVKQVENKHIQNEKQLDMFSSKFIYLCSRFNLRCENSVMQFICKKD